MNKKPALEVRFNNGQVEQYNNHLKKYVPTGETVEEYLSKIKDHMDLLEQTRKLIDASN